MFFPVSGVEVSPFVPPLVAFVISFFASMGGISGAFLLLPFQMSALGYTNPSVSATNQFYNVVATPGGVWRYLREGRMLWPLAITIAAGTLPGVFAGAFIRVMCLPDPRYFKLFAAGVLLWIGGRLLRDLLRPPSGAKVAGGDGNFVVRTLEFSRKKIAYNFRGADYQCPTIAVFLLSLVVGLVGGVYGIGGGAIIAPFLISWFGLPVHTIGGATLMGTFLTSVAGVFFYTLIAPLFPGQAVSPDWILGLLFGLGGLVGMYCGARLQKFVSAALIKWMLSLVIFGTALNYVAEFFR
jgi:uncharacterized membrane protein YfcA